MKKVIINTIALLLQLCMWGQTQKTDPRLHSKVPGDKDAFWKDQFEDIKNNAEFVFEGIRKKVEQYPRIDKDGNEYCVTSTIIKIKRVFRGKLKQGTLELITTIKPYGNYVINLEEPRIPTKRRIVQIDPNDSVYLYFCKVAGNQYPHDTKYNIYPVDNKKILTVANNYLSCETKLPTDLLYQREIPGGDLYKYLASWPNMDKSAFYKSRHDNNARYWTCLVF